MEPLVDQARSARLSVDLWALDEISPALAEWTRGVGSGPRLALLNRLIARSSGRGPLVLCDDDIRFEAGTLQDLLDLTRRAQLDLAQPAHVEGSFISHGVTAQQPGSVARRTRFVEIGPVVVVGRRIRKEITPLPEHLGMGWGLDVMWSDLHHAGYRLGVVDAAGIRHLARAATAYPTEAEQAQLTRFLDERGLSDMSAFDDSVDTWVIGERRAPWVQSRTQRWRNRMAVRRRLRIGRASRADSRK